MSVADGLRHDLRWSLHLMRRHPGLTASVVVSLGLTIGANTTVFSVLHAFLLRPLAIQDVDRVVRVRENMAAPGQRPDLRSLQGPNYGPWRAQNRVFTDIAAGTWFDAALTGEGRPEHLSAALVSANFFPVLGIKPFLGRSIAPEEDQPGRDQVVLLSYDLWVTRFGAAPGVVGRRVTLNGISHAVIGVMPRGFHHPYQAQIWLPLAYSGASSLGQEYYAPARLKPGIALQRARAEMNDLATRLWQEDPRPNTPRSANLSPMREELVHGLDKLLYLLAAGSAFVLLIACVNVANLLLAQGLQQGREAAVRLALGASRLRVARQVLIHSLLLAALGAALGALFAASSIKPLVALSPASALGEFDIEPRLDLSTLGFTIGAALLVGVVFGLLPALRLSRTSIGGSLQAAGRTLTLRRSGQRLLGALVIAEVALSLMLLVGAGLVLRSFERLQGENRGFDVRDTLSFSVSLPESRFPGLRRQVAFVRPFLDRLRDLPSVVAVGATTTDPLFPGTNATGVAIEGRPATGPTGLETLHHRAITPGYLESLRVPLIAGRLFTDHDDERAPLVAIVSKSMAERYWPGGSAIGKRVKRGRTDSNRPWITVVGVVGSLKENDDWLPYPDAWYLPYTQSTVGSLDGLTFTLRARGSALALAPMVREAARAVDRDQPIYDVMTMEQRLAQRTTPERFSAVLYTSFGVLGLMLAALGIYGVLAFVVDQRLPEIGIRSALGARPGHLRALVLRFALLLTVGGLAVGILGALLLTRLMSSQLYQISPYDPVVLLSALACLGAIALVSCYVPASRAARVDPVRVLRQE
ncbi:MAG TPA: ABC transporter permease [Thermoanaerobaculia bacterium]|nr:ABC transporter permease [Thermoanaerobaculia bacterium]